MAADWLEDLAEFGPEIVAEACKEWRRKPGGRRPTPGDIRALCIEEQRAAADREAVSRYRALPKPTREPRISEEDRREARELTDRLARERGYDDFDAFLAAGGSIVELAGLPPVVKRGDAIPREFNISSERLAADRQKLIDDGLMDGEAA